MASEESGTNREAGHGEPEDPLVRLEQRLDRASQAAERMISEATQAVRRPPPAGWQPPEPEADSEAPRFGGGEFELLFEAIRTLRDRIPPDLQRRLGEALRELLLAVRALIDWYLERGERRRREPAEVQDIPIL